MKKSKMSGYKKRYSKDTNKRRAYGSRTYAPLALEPPKFRMTCTEVYDVKSVSALEQSIDFNVARF